MAAEKITLEEFHTKPRTMSNEAAILDECNSQGTNQSSTDASHSLCSDISDEELIHDLQNTLTLEPCNPRGQSRNRSSRVIATQTEEDDRRHHKKLLRDKFEIESLYIEISELKRQNEALWRIWESVVRQKNGSDVRMERSSPIPSGIQTRQQMYCSDSEVSD